MRYQVKLNPSNLQAHLDIEGDIQRIRDGVVNIVIKINRELITDYVIYENDNANGAEFTVAPID